MPSATPIIHIHYALKGPKQPFGSALIPSGRSVYHGVSRLILQITLGEKVVGDSFKFGYAPLAQRALYLVYEFAARISSSPSSRRVYLLVMEFQE